MLHYPEENIEMSVKLMCNMNVIHVSKICFSIYKSKVIEELKHQCTITNE